MRQIGIEIPKVDVLEKALGEAKYGADLPSGEPLHLTVLRSPKPYAKIVRIEKDEALRIPGVERIFTAKDIPGKNLVGTITKDQPILASDRVKYIGDPVALVAAKTEEALEEAAKKLVVVYEDLPSITHPEEALQPYAPLIHEKGNLLLEFHVIKGDSQRGFKEAEVIVLAIKPQNLAKVMAELKSQLKPNQLVLSIVAGARINTLCLGLNHRHVVRSMPNTPAQIGEGITVWTATAEVTEPQKKWTGSILGVLGKEIFVADEKYLDMATAVSGSGPAYFFLFVESLVESAVHIGLPRDTAEKLVLQTMLGSAHLIQKSGKPPAELRRMVTSPGGTTAEALLQFDKGGFSQLVMQAVTAAYNKAKQLGN